MQHNNIIPKGGVYFSKDGKVYEEGDIMPAPKTGDRYMFGD